MPTLLHGNFGAITETCGKVAPQLFDKLGIVSRTLFCDIGWMCCGRAQHMAAWLVGIGICTTIEHRFQMCTIAQYLIELRAQVLEPTS